MLSDATKSKCTFYKMQGHAKNNCCMEVEHELFERKYKRKPYIHEYWDMDSDIKTAAEKLVNSYYQKGCF